MRTTLSAFVPACIGLASVLVISVGGAQAAPGAIGAVARSAAPAITNVEYFCSPGFEPSYGGTCVAVPSRAEVEIYVEQPIYDTSETVHHHARRAHHRGIRERY